MHFYSTQKNLSNGAMFLKMSLILEGATEKLSQFISLKLIHNKTFVLMNKNVFFNI
jgi:hypothetical protein